MAIPRTSSPMPASFTPRRAPLGVGLAFTVVFAGAWLGGCAGLLGIEDASCDPDFDPRCDGDRSVGMLTPGAGSGGRAMTGAGGSAGAAGAGGSAGADVAGAGGVPTDVPMERPLCERYCDTVAAACPGDLLQYATLEGCTKVCEALEPGEPGDMSGNSVECRLTRAQLARRTGEPAPYCYTAGPGGGGVCGTDCEGFCKIMAASCTLLGSYEECLPRCAAVPNLADDDEPRTYETSIQNGDSVQCRLYHVTAATVDPGTHCSHAAGLALCVADGLL